MDSFRWLGVFIRLLLAQKTAGCKLFFPQMNRERPQTAKLLPGEQQRQGVKSEWQLVKLLKICGIWDQTRCWHSSDSGAEFPGNDGGDTSAAGTAWAVA
jgi:hypothetical protein